jgi:hypothetical protein
VIVGVQHCGGQRHVVEQLLEARLLQPELALDALALDQFALCLIVQAAIVNGDRRLIDQ